ncbi:hypothetical protein [Paenibacillus arenosi]|uniref:DUF4829 domain-containing protein n=1 Tax=Paenibacillus arenosi TaxID=2774142 RepID=A0ABR9B4F8_9BACL|nr:hypothetical protein [Paenibacillus arenosi]MBD8501194.1 hypothetical protein [Paenibacillus arenosi]
MVTFIQSQLIGGNFIKRLCIAAIAIGVLLSGCSQKETTTPPIEKEQGEKPSTPEQTENQFTPLDESKYEGIENEMIKLVNLHAKYVNTKDETNFKKLFHNQDYKLPSYEVLKNEMHEFRDMKQTQGYVAVKRTSRSLETNGVIEGYSVFFISSNKKGEWKINGID